MVRPLRVLVFRFFQLLEKGQFAEAERMLERLKERMTDTEWNKGYYQALSGMALSLRSKDDMSFMATANLKDEKELKRYRREFLKQSSNKIHANYDRGFFSAWTDYVRTLLKLRETERVVDGGVRARFFIS